MIFLWGLKPALKAPKTPLCGKNWCNFPLKGLTVFSEQQTIPGDLLFPRTSEWFVTTVNHHGFRICYTLSHCLDVTLYLRSQHIHVRPSGLYLLARPSPTAFNLWRRECKTLPDSVAPTFLLFMPAAPSFRLQTIKVLPPSRMCNGTVFRLIKAVWDAVCQNMCQHIKDRHNTPCTVNTKPVKRVALAP